MAVKLSYEEYCEFHKKVVDETGEPNPTVYIVISYLKKNKIDFGSNTTIYKYEKRRAAEEIEKTEREKILPDDFYEQTQNAVKGFAINMFEYVKKHVDIQQAEREEEYKQENNYLKAKIKFSLCSTRVLIQQYL